ncbi:MAG: 50S ribosomal protein L9 [Bacteroidetes bacterium]|nr:50S ribosomal protein L9 [Bacteroidota bacterium]
MEIILKEDVEHLGFKYDLVKVKDGFARNFLIPNGFAELATESVKKQREETLRQRAGKEEKLKELATKTAELLANTEIIVFAKAGEKGKIFGSISKTQVADAVAKLGHKIDKRHLSLGASAIKEVGKYTATIKLHREVSAEFTFEVKKEKVEVKKGKGKK